MNQRYLVSTTMGDMTVDPDSPVYVQIDKMHFLRKRPYDLNIGDMITFPKPFARTSIDDVEPLLFRSPRYARAWELLHETNSNGEQVSLLRTLLIRGLRDHGFFGNNYDNDEIERKIMQEGDDFSMHEIDSMADYIRRILVEHDDIYVGETTPSYWLRGFTKAPHGLDRMGARIVEVLGEELNPSFRNWNYHDTSPTSVYYNYRLQNVIKSRIMWYLNECRGTHIGREERERDREEHITVSPEYELVFRHFFKDISRDLASARITNVSRLESRRQIEVARDRSFRLEDGIIDETVQFLKESEKNYLDIFAQSNLMEAYFSALVEDYTPLGAGSPSVSLILNYTGQVPERVSRLFFSLDAIPSIIESFGEPLDEEIQYVLNLQRRPSRRCNEEIFRQHYEQHQNNLRRLMNDVLDGVIDNFYGFDRGTAIKIVEALATSRKAYAPAITRYLKLVQQFCKTFIDVKLPIGDRKMKKEILRESARQRKILRDDYGLHFNGLESNYKFVPRGCPQLLSNTGLLLPEVNARYRFTLREYLERHRNDKDKIERLLSELPEDRVLLNREQAIEILENNDLSQIIDLRWQDFIWEDLGIDIGV